MDEDWIARGGALAGRLVDDVRDYDFYGLWLQASADPAWFGAVAVAVAAVLVTSRSLWHALAAALALTIALFVGRGIVVAPGLIITLAALSGLCILVAGWRAHRDLARHAAANLALAEEKVAIEEKLADEIRWRMASEATAPARPATPAAGPGVAANGEAAGPDR